MTTRIKPILGMWATLMVLSLIMTFLRPEAWSGENAIFGQWPTFALAWLVSVIFFDWVIQTTGMGVTQAAIVLAGATILASGPLWGWLFFGQAAGLAGVNAVQRLVFWYVSAVAYGKLSNSEQSPAYE